MHPIEAYRQRTGTGRLASLSLKNSEIIIGEIFDDNRRTQQLISDPSYFPMVLFPGRDASFAETFDYRESAENRELLIFLIDGTWDQAKKMMFHSKTLQILPRLTFSRKYRSNFKIKKQPADYCLSTIESTCYLIRELQKSQICPPEADTDVLLSVFNRMVRFQIDCENKYSGKNKHHLPSPDKKETFVGK